MKKIITLLLTASLLALSMVACGGGAPGGEIVDGKFDNWRGGDETSKNNGDGSYEAGTYDEANSDDWTDNY